MFSHLPQLNSIRVFDSAARLKSFKAAALELNLTPTAVSHQIRNLEKKLGTLLFERKTRSIHLTLEGQKLAEVAQQSLQAISGVMEEISNKQSVLTVSTTTAFAAQWLIPKVTSFHHQYPEISIEIKTGEQAENLQKDRRVDVAIRYGLFDPQIENASQLITEKFGMYATSQYLHNFPHLEKATLLETNWKNPKLPPITWKQYFLNKGADPNKLDIRSYDQEHHVIQAALAGQGVALVSTLLVQTALQQEWLHEHSKGESLNGLSYYMLSATPPKNSRKVSVFQAWLLEELRHD
jgi:DNA-binding transcriptional LysR family regulator